MPGVPSNRACERCKKKHLKCDETRPYCQRCSTSGVECPGYVQTRKFIDQGATVRRRYAPYQEPHAKPGPTATGSKSDGNTLIAEANTPEVVGTHQQHPSHLHSSDENDNDNEGTFDLPLTDTPFNLNNNFQMVDTAGLPDPSSAMTSEMQLPIAQPSDGHTLPNPSPLVGFEGSRGSPRSTIDSTLPENPAIGLGSTLENSHNAGFNDRPDFRRIISTESVSQRSEKEEFQDIFSELMTGTEHEVSFLTRHYTEVIGPWLDLSDSGKFFSVFVPIRAINNPFLRYSIAALAAKQLARVKGTKLSTKGGMSTNPATTEMYPNAAQVDWFLKAANYYYLAASDLNNSTSNGYTALSTSAVLESPIEMINRWLSTQSPQRAGHTTNNGPFMRKTEDMVAAVVLLTFYRLLDTKGEEWPVHLTGIRLLFNRLVQPDLMDGPYFPHGIRAAFWNLARQDYLGSYFTRTATHLDPEDLALWRAAGISIDDRMKFYIDRSRSPELSQDNQAANGLSWLVSKVINFLARTKQSQIAQWTGSPSDSISGAQNASTDTNTWLDLCFDFQTWFEGVPETFRPCVRIEHPRDFCNPAEVTELPFPEVFHSQATCAFAMQHYHFGRVALLLNRPPDIVSAPSTAFDRLQGYREVTKEVEYRCREVCGIAIGRPPGEVRIHMVPLLFAVGQCLESADEHQIIVNLLNGVEADLGWATEDAVQKLEASWNR